MRGATIRTSGKKSISRKGYSKVPAGSGVKGAMSKGASSRSSHSMGFHAGQTKGSVNGSTK